MAMTCSTSITIKDVIHALVDQLATSHLVPVRADLQTAERRHPGRDGGRQAEREQQGELGSAEPTEAIRVSGALAEDQAERPLAANIDNDLSNDLTNNNRTHSVYRRENSNV